MFRDVEMSPVLPSAFVTLAEAKAYLGIAGTGSDDLLTALLLQSAVEIESYCSTVITQRTITERMALDAEARSLVLRYAPAIALTSLSFDAVAETVGDYRLAKELATVRSIQGSQFSAGADWVAVYTAGFATVPDAIKNAAKEIIKDAYNAASRDATIARESVADVGETEYRAEAESKAIGAGGVQVSHRAASMLAPYVLRYSS
jgi:hypothetical protein